MQQTQATNGTEYLECRLLSHEKGPKQASMNDYIYKNVIKRRLVDFWSCLLNLNAFSEETSYGQFNCARKKLSENRCRYLTSRSSG